MEITGRLVADATVRETKNNKSLTGFTIAVNRRYVSKGEQVEDTSYFDCSYWRTVNIAPHLKKGMVVQLSGHVSASAWLDRDGGLHAGLNFHVNELNMLTAAIKQPEQRANEQTKPAQNARTNNTRVRTNNKPAAGINPSTRFN